MPKRDYKLSEESAQAQIELFLDWYGLDFDELFKKEGDKTDRTREGVKNRLIKCVRKGYIEVKEEAAGGEKNSSGESTLVVMQHLDRAVHGKQEVKYNEFCGRHRAAVTVLEGENETAQMYRLLGLVTGEGKEFFDSLRGADIGVADMLGFLFLLV